MFSSMKNMCFLAKILQFDAKLACGAVREAAKARIRLASASVMHDCARGHAAADSFVFVLIENCP